VFLTVKIKKKQKRGGKQNTKCLPYFTFYFYFSILALAITNKTKNKTKNLEEFVFVFFLSFNFIPKNFLEVFDSKFYPKIKQFSQ